MIPSLSHLPRGLAALISHYGWTRVAVVTETESQLVVVSPSTTLTYYYLVSPCPFSILPGL